MKYFISQAMNGRSDYEIRAERQEVINAMIEKNPEAEVIDSFFCGAPHDAKPLWFLGKSFELLSGADMCVFVDDSGYTSRGCILERMACEKYGIDCCVYRTDNGAFEANG